MPNTLRPQRPGAFRASFFDKSKDSRVLLEQMKQQKLKRSKRELIDLGGVGDCFFRSAVMSLIDGMLSSKKTSFQPIKKLITPLVDEEISDEQLPKVFNHLVDEFGGAALIEFMADMMRQEAVDEIVTYPEEYRGAFTDITERTSPVDMRQQTNWADETAIAATARTLNVSTSVSAVTALKTLPLVLTYNSSANQEPATSDALIHVQLNSGHYRALVENKAQCMQVLQKPAKQAIPEIPKSVKPDVTQAEIDMRTKAADERTLKKFEEYEMRLVSAITMDGVDRSQLLRVYVENLPNGDYLAGHRKYMSTSVQNALEAKMINASAHHPFEDSMTEELVHAIARAISIGQMSESAIDEIKPSASVGPK